MAVPKLSVPIITLNEAKNLAAVLAAVCQITPDIEIIVVDSGSSDATVAIAESFGATVVHQAWQGFAAQKNLALAHCTGHYILSLDADEVPDSKLIKEIQKVLHKGERTAYFLRRHAVYMQRVMKYAFCDKKLRLVHRSLQPVWVGARVHESLSVLLDPGKIHLLNGKLLHYSYEHFEDHLTRSIQYSRLSALNKFEAGEQCSIFKLIVKPWLAFLKSYVLKGGILDGLPGLIVSKMRALDVFEKYLFLYEHIQIQKVALAKQNESQ